MTTDQFMLWRFRMTDGVLDGIKTFNVNETVFENSSKFIYDPVNEIVQVINHNSQYSMDETMRFRELTKEKLISMGFKERNYNRHSSSFGEYTFPFTK